MVVSTFEDHLPVRYGKIDIPMRPDCPAGLSESEPGFQYYAYLRKDRLFSGHLFEPLNRAPTLSRRGERWYADEETRNCWQNIDARLSHTITALSVGLLFELGQYEPKNAAHYGFTRGHKSESALKLSLRCSKYAFVHRLGYLAYLISRRYNWGEESRWSQPWYDELRAKFDNTWVDSVWEAIHAQWEARNFIGVVVKSQEASVRWLEAALRFGVPIWISYPYTDDLAKCYAQLDGAHVMRPWLPSPQQVAESRKWEMAKAEAFAARTQLSGMYTTAPLLGSQTDTLLDPQPTHPQNPPPTRPGTIPTPLHVVLPHSHKALNGMRVGKSSLRNVTRGTKSGSRRHRPKIGRFGRIGVRTRRSSSNLARAGRRFMTGKHVILEGFCGSFRHTMMFPRGGKATSERGWSSTPGVTSGITVISCGSLLSRTGLQTTWTRTEASSWTAGTLSQTHRPQPPTITPHLSISYTNATGSFRANPQLVWRPFRTLDPPSHAE
jgi:hypothetical protein